MTHIVGLRLTNYRRYRGTHELELGPGTYAVVAEYETDKGRSNWLGKSDLLGAIRYCLEGHKCKSAKTLDDLISWGEDLMGVDVELSDGTFVSRQKKRGKGTDLQVVVPRHDPQADDGRTLELYKEQAEAAIAKALGMSVRDLETTAIAEQRKLAKLVTDDEGFDLADVVASWLELAPLQTASDVAGTELRAVSKAYAGKLEALTACEERIAARNPTELLARLAQLRAEVNDQAARVAANRVRIAEHDAWVRLKERHDAAAAATVEVTRLVGDQVAVLGDRAPLQAALDAATKLANATDEDWKAKRRLATGEFPGLCPVNGKNCPITAEINADQKTNAGLLAAATTTRTAAAQRLQAAAAPLEAYDRSKRQQDRAAAYLQQARDAAAKLTTGLELLPPEPDTTALVAGIGVSLELEEVERAMAAHDADLTLREGLALAVTELRHKTAVHRAAFAVLGPDGAQRRISERCVGAIEQTANADLAAAGIDLSLAVRWGRETKKPAEQCPQCGTAFPKSTTIKVCEGCRAPRGMKVTPELHFKLSNVSGAAEDLVGLAVRCAAFKWLRARRGAQWSVAILDEPFAQCDAANERALATHIQRMLTGAFDQAFVVAHRQSVLDGIPHRILITGSGKWSSVKVVA